MDQNELKKLVAKAALADVRPGEILGVGTGSTVDFFIDALAQSGLSVPACVSSSVRSTRRLEQLGFRVLEMNEVDGIGVYVDGADEIDAGFNMIKGGGGALTREKIVASVARKFVCIADASKRLENARDAWKRHSIAEKEANSLVAELAGAEKEFEELKHVLGVCPLCGGKL
jgi:ribose 5-phosphate isomerase A